MQGINLNYLAPLQCRHHKTVVGVGLESHLNMASTLHEFLFFFIEVKKTSESSIHRLQRSFPSQALDPLHLNTIQSTFQLAVPSFIRQSAN